MIWSRGSVVLVALWLLASPSVLARPQVWDALAVPIAGALAAVAVVVASARWPLARSLLLVVAFGLILWGWARFPRPGPPPAQNAIVVGLVLGLLGVVPDRALEPPPAWRPHVRED